MGDPRTLAPLNRRKSGPQQLDQMHSHRQVAPFPDEAVRWQVHAGTMTNAPPRSALSDWFGDGRGCVIFI